MRVKRTTLAIIIIASILTAVLGLYLMNYTDEAPPILLGSPVGGQERPYEIVGVIVMIIGFTVLTVSMWVGAIHTKIEKVKELQMQLDKGEMSEEEFKKKIDALLREI